MKFRWLLVSSFFIVLYGLLISELYELQLRQNLYYSAKAASQLAFDESLRAKRGIIYFTDRNGSRIPAAQNRNFPVIYAVPAEIENIGEAAAKLASVTGVSEEVLKTRFSKPDDHYEIILDKASNEQVDAVVGLGLPGIYTDSRTLRFYPFDGLASQVIGFTGVNKDNDRPIGLYGLELLYESALKGRDGYAEGDVVVSSEPGRNINLTLDRNLQLRSEEILDKLIDEFGAEGGTVIIQEPKNGKILAMANKPDFNPNFYSKYSLGDFINPAVQSVYEPGSVFKVITMAAGIGSGKITPVTSYYDEGSVKVADRTITNWDHKAHGRVTMTEVIEKSINTGAVYAEKETGHENFLDYLFRFGFGRETAIDLPGEASGNLINLIDSPNQAVNFATASFGQGVAVTPTQLVSAISAIANKGVLMEPYLNSDSEPVIAGQAIGEKTAAQVSEMMMSAVDKAGVAAIPNYRIAGKTGTAQVPDFKNGGYSSQFIHTFVGFGPVSDPKFTILIKLDKPESNLAALTVVPAFRNLAEFVINYYGIQPDRL